MSIRNGIGAMPIVLLVLVSGCAEEKAEAPSRPKGVLITATTTATKPIQRLELTVGRVESKSDPDVAAEVSGRVTRIHAEVGDRVQEGQALAVIEPEDYRLENDSADADIGRLQAMIEQQQRLVARYEALKEDDFFPQNTFDEAQSQLKVLKQQLASAQSHLTRSQRDLARTEIRSPLVGRVKERLIDAGDYVTVGTLAFSLSTDDVLRIVLPFPERLADTVAVGQTVLLASPLNPDSQVEAKITEVRPTVGTANRAIDAIVELANPGNWKAGGSINGSLVLEQKSDAQVVPQTSVVLRPSGSVVYVLGTDDKVAERVVKTGIRFGRDIEIIEGLEPGERIAVDGAAFLTDGAFVRIAKIEG